MPKTLHESFLSYAFQTVIEALDHFKETKQLPRPEHVQETMTYLADVRMMVEAGAITIRTDVTDRPTDEIGS